MNKLWHIQMLGGLRLRRGTEEITRFRTRQTSALLAYLAFFPRPHNRETLIERYWPGSAADSGRNNMRVALASLRRQLEPPDVPPGTIIVANHSWVQLQDAAVLTDVRAFEAELARAAQSHDTSEREKHLAAALELYEGPLLPGFYDDWIPLEESRLEELFLNAAQRLIALCLTRGDETTARQWAHHAARAAPQRDEVRTWLDALGALPTRDSSTRLVVKHSAASSKTPARLSSALAVMPEAPVSALPPILNRFFGRESEMEFLRDLLDSPETHLITLTGSGGSGKTRLALELAHHRAERFGAEVYFVSLAEVTAAPFLSDAIAAALSLPAPVSSSPLPALPRVIEALNNRPPCLLILDNFEQLLPGGASDVKRLMEQVASLKCLVTSRQNLNLPGECDVPVGPLKMPVVGESEPERLQEMAAVRLFVDRAQARRADFQITPHNAAALGALIRRLEGIPLAIELCSAQSRVLSPRQILAQLESGEAFSGAMRSGLAARHNSLRDAFEWSYSLLTPPLQEVFRTLAVFRGGFSLEAATVVCRENLVLPALAFLRDASLLQSSEIVVAPDHSEMRFSMLETVRAFAETKLSDAERLVFGERHARHYLEVAEKIKAAPTGSMPGWPNVLEREQDNFWSALQWSGEHDEELALRFVPALRDYWIAYHPVHGRAAIESLASRVLRGEIAASSQAQAEVLCHAGELALRVHQLQRAREFLEASLPHAQAAEDRDRQVAVLSALGLSYLEEGDREAAQRHFEAAMAISRAVDEVREGKANIAWTLRHRGALHREQGDFEAASLCFTEALMLFRATGDENGAAWVLLNQAGLAATQSDWANATTLCDEALEYFRRRGHKSGLMWTLHQRGEIARHLNEPNAQELLEESLSFARQLDEQIAVALCLKSLEALT